MPKKLSRSSLATRSLRSIRRRFSVVDRGLATVLGLSISIWENLGNLIMGAARYLDVREMDRLLAISLLLRWKFSFYALASFERFGILFISFNRLRTPGRAENMNSSVGIYSMSRCK